MTKLNADCKTEKLTNEKDFTEYLNKLLNDQLLNDELEHFLSLIPSTYPLTDIKRLPETFNFSQFTRVTYAINTFSSLRLIVYKLIQVKDKPSHRSIKNVLLIISLIFKNDVTLSEIKRYMLTVRDAQDIKAAKFDLSVNTLKNLYNYIGTERWNINVKTVKMLIIHICKCRYQYFQK